MPLLILLLVIALQILLSSKKVSPFLSLLVSAMLAGFLLGMAPAALLEAVKKGVGDTLAGLALIICLGAVLGKLLEMSGAAAQIASTLIRSFGEKNIQWAVLATGFLVGIPLFYNAGFIILLPLVYSIAKKARVSLLYVALPMAASLSATHCFLPPHPGPVVLVNEFKASMGKTLLFGIIMALPAVILAGPLLGKVLQKMRTQPPALFDENDQKKNQNLPPVLTSFFVALLPVLLITLAVVAQYFIPEGGFKKLLLFMGDSTIALLLSVCLAIWLLGLRRGESMPTLMKWLNEGISGIALILLIITSGGVLKQVLIDSGTGSYISSFSSEWQMLPLLFAWIITALLRVAIGSATVAGITAAGIVAPLLTTGVSPELMVLAVGAGTVFGSHVNDTGFWMFKEFFGLTLKQTFLSWTLMESLISVSGLLMVLLLSLFV